MTKNKLIKVGIIGIGAGGIGETHFEALRRIGGVKVAAICTLDQEWATSYAEKHAIQKVYTDYRELINDKEIEVIHIATPNNLHYEQVIYALEAGRHVVCEKPLGVNTAQTAKMLSLVKEKKLAHALCYNHRFLPLIFHAREIVRRGDLGAITFIRGYAMDDFMMAIDQIDPNHWRTSPETVGLSKNMSVFGGHLLDLLQQNFVSEKGGQLEDHANLLLRFGNGIKGTVLLSEAAPGHKCEVFLEIVGTEGCVAWNLQKINEIWIGCRTQPNKLLYKGAELLYPEAQAIAAPPSWGQDGFSESFRQLFDAVYRHIKEEKYLLDSKRVIIWS
jgi:predicted dehydrogenase